MKNGIFKGISNNVILLGFVSFLNDLSSEMILPILPMFIESLGGSKLAVGIVGGVRDSLSSLLNLLSGYLAARSGRSKVLVFLGYLTSAVFKFFLSLSATFGQAVWFSSLERVGKGLRTAPRDAIIAESMSQRKGAGFGVHRAFDTAGAILGSLMTFLLLWLFSFSLKGILIIAAGLSAVCLIPLIFVRDVQMKPQGKKPAFGFRALPAGLRFFLVIAAIFALGNFSYMFFVLRAGQFFEGRWSSILPVLFYVLFNIVGAAFVMPLGFLADRIGKSKVIALGYLLFAAACLGFVFIKSGPLFAVLFAVYGLSVAAIDGNQRAFVADLAGGSLKAIALGTYHTMVGLAALPAGLVAGLLSKYGAPAAFVYGGLIGLVCAIVLISFNIDMESKE